MRKGVEGSGRRGWLGGSRGGRCDRRLRHGSCRGRGRRRSRLGGGGRAYGRLWRRRRFRHERLPTEIPGGAENDYCRASEAEDQPAFARRLGRKLRGRWLREVLRDLDMRDGERETRLWRLRRGDHRKSGRHSRRMGRRHRRGTTGRGDGHGSRNRHRGWDNRRSGRRVKDHGGRWRRLRLERDLRVGTSISGSRRNRCGRLRGWLRREKKRWDRGARLRNRRGGGRR